MEKMIILSKFDFDLEYSYHKWSEATMLGHIWTLLCMDLSCWLKKIDSRIKAENDAKYDKKSDDTIHPSTSGGNTTLEKQIKSARFSFHSHLRSEVFLLQSHMN